MDAMNGIVTDYAVASANDHNELVIIVGEQIRNGYQPYGFPYTTIQGNVLFIHQPMVKFGITNKVSSKVKYNEYTIKKRNRSAVG